MTTAEIHEMETLVQLMTIGHDIIGDTLFKRYLVLEKRWLIHLSNNIHVFVQAYPQFTMDGNKNANVK